MKFGSRTVPFCSGGNSKSSFMIKITNAELQNSDYFGILGSIVLFAPSMIDQTHMESIDNLLFYTRFLHTVIAVLFMALRRAQSK